MSTGIYDQITERIIALLTQGTVPWHKPWKARTGLPRNLVSQKPYRGINVFLLLTMSYESTVWPCRSAIIIPSIVSRSISRYF